MATAATHDAQVTTDALVSLRSNRGLQRGFGIEDPAAAHFVNAASRAMTNALGAVDPVFLPYSLARYRYFGERIRAAVEDSPQLLMLGVGFDARPRWDPALVEASCTILEVDQADKLAYREAVLARAGLARGPHVRPCPADLTSPELAVRLAEDGYDPEKPCFAVMEGVSYLLPADAVRMATHPRAAPLARGSTLLFDVWTRARLDLMEQRARRRLFQPLFGEPGLGDDERAITDTLTGMGYQDVQVQPLAAIARRYDLDFADDDTPSSWLVVEARV